MAQSWRGSHLASRWKKITKRDVGKYWEGFGYVQAQDVGKLYYKDSGGYYVENNEQRAKRLERGGSSQKNPGAASIPRGKWVNAQVMVTSSGQIKAKIPASVMRRRNPGETFSDLPIGAIFKFKGSSKLSGGGSFLGQSTYKKTGTRSYVPADVEEAKARLLDTYSGYPDIARKLKGARLTKAITLKVGSVKAEVERH